MPKNQWRLRADSANVAQRVRMQVAPADSNGGHIDQDLARAGFHVGAVFYSDIVCPIKEGAFH
jgi:hypothetical protein